MIATALAGCAGAPDPQEGGEDDDVPVVHPAPKTLLERKQTTSDIPTGSNPMSASIEVESPYDALDVFHHVSGVGTYRLSIADSAGDIVYDTDERQSTSEPDSHSTAPVGAQVPVTAGAYSVAFTWTGGITYHVSVVAKVAAAGDDGPGHDHP